jgi:hypothetical protein
MEPGPVGTFVVLGSERSESAVPVGLVGELSSPDLVCAEVRIGMTVMRMIKRINFAFMFLLLSLFLHFDS